MQHEILLLARPTPKDFHFYERYRSLGDVYSELPTRKANITILVVDQRVTVNEDLLAKLPHLKWIVSATTGHSHLKIDPKKQGVKLITLRGETRFLSEVRSVSEFTMRLILTLARPLGGYGCTLNNKILGILGLGRIGKHVLFLGSSFGMRAHTFDLSDGYSKLERLFRESDFISVHLSENVTTQGFVSAELIGMMKREAYLINTARASVIDERALSLALRAGKIAGAALDVVDEKAYFRDLDQVILTPHIAGSTLEDRIKTDEFIVEKLKREIELDAREQSQRPSSLHIPSRL